MWLSVAQLHLRQGPPPRNHDLMQNPPSKRTADKSKRSRASPPKNAAAPSVVQSEIEPAEPEAELKEPETRDWLTRNDTSDLLRCSMQTLKNYENRELLHPRWAVRRDRTGAERWMVVYDPKELAQLPKKNPEGPREFVRQPGEQAARAFEMFRQGYELDEIVIELRETPERIDQLHEHWREQTKARWVLNPEARKLLEQMVGQFKSVADLVDLLGRRVIALEAKLLLEGILGEFNTTSELVELVGRQVIKADAKNLLEGALGKFETVTELVRYAIKPETKTTLLEAVGEFKTVPQLVTLLETRSSPS